MFSLFPLRPLFLCGSIILSIKVITYTKKPAFTGFKVTSIKSTFEFLKTCRATENAEERGRTFFIQILKLYL